jgi:ferritin-like metal-binding protein YciE
MTTLSSAAGNKEMEQRLPQEGLSKADLLTFFLAHLNRVYCAKNQLVEKLPELSGRAHFLDLKQAIEETVDVVYLQIQRMKQMYILLDSIYHFEHCTGLIGLLDEAFQSIGPKSDHPELRDLSILFYMQNIESIEMASFKILMLVAAKMEIPGVVELLQECYDEAKEDRVLLTQITQSYV